MASRASSFRGLAGRLAFVAVSLLPPAATQAVPAAAPPVAAQQALRERILAVARDYAGFEWHGTERNVLHGPDANGTPVDTPDVSFDAKGWKPDGANHGMPYAWGGFTSIEEFRAGLAQGRPAGQVPTSERARASASAMGLDCSGFIARCWDLPVKQSTRSLGALCYSLPDQAALQPGDILNLFDGHVVLFESWVDDTHARMRVFEAARLVVKESEYPAAGLTKSGFVPMRYKPLDERWVPMELGEIAFDAGSAEGHWTASGPGVPLSESGCPSPLRDARRLAWARYGVGTGERTTLVAAVDGERVDTQTDETLDGRTISTGRSCEHAPVLIDALLDFAAPEEPLSDLGVTEGTATPGTWELAGRRFPAWRVEARLQATHVVRHAPLPVTIRVEAVLSSEVPVHGVLEASFTWDTVWSAEPGKEPLIGRHVTRSALRAFGGMPRTR